MNTRRGWRAVVALTTAILAAAAFQTGMAAGAHASTTNDTVMATTQRMAGPTLNTTQAGWYSVGSHLNLQCYARGESVKGYYSRYIPGDWDNLWYKVSDGYWAADVDINTGSNNPVTGACSSPTPPPSSTTATRAVAWANSQIGSMSYPGLCELFMENAYGTSGRYASAITAFRSLQAAGQIHTSSTGIPAGALVFSESPSGTRDTATSCCREGTAPSSPAVWRQASATIPRCRPSTALLRPAGSSAGRMPPRVGPADDPQRRPIG